MHNGSSPTLKWLSPISLHTVRFSQCALKQLQVRQSHPHFLAGGCAASSSPFLPNLNVVGPPISSMRFQLFQSWRLIDTYGLYLGGRTACTCSLPMNGHFFRLTPNRHFHICITLSKSQPTSGLRVLERSRVL